MFAPVPAAGVLAKGFAWTAEGALPPARGRCTVGVAIALLMAGFCGFKLSGRLFAGKRCCEPLAPYGVNTGPRPFWAGVALGVVEFAGAVVAVWPGTRETGGTSALAKFIGCARPPVRGWLNPATGETPPALRTPDPVAPATAGAAGAGANAAAREACSELRMAPCCCIAGLAATIVVPLLANCSPRPANGAALDCRTFTVCKSLPVARTIGSFPKPRLMTVLLFPLT